MTVWLLVVLIVSPVGVVSRPVEEYKTISLCRQAQDAEYRTGLYAPFKDGFGRLLYCTSRTK